MPLPAKGQVYNYTRTSYSRWGEAEGTVTEVLRIEDISNGAVTYRTGSHSGNLTESSFMSIHSFNDDIKNKKLILTKDVPVVYEPPINRLDWVD